MAQDLTCMLFLGEDTVRSRMLKSATLIVIIMAHVCHFSAKVNCAPQPELML
jgi:hypothetical protein